MWSRSAQWYWCYVKVGESAPLTMLNPGRIFQLIVNSAGSLSISVYIFSAFTCVLCKGDPGFRLLAAGDKRGREKKCRNSSCSDFGQC